MRPFRSRAMQSGKRMMNNTGSLANGSGNELIPLPIVNLTASLKRLLGSKKLLADMIGFYNADYPGLMQRLTNSLREGKQNEAKRAAHSLWNLAANFDAHQVLTIIDHIKTLIDQSSFAAAEKKLPALTAALERVRVALNETN